MGPTVYFSKKVYYSFGKRPGQWTYTFDFADQLCKCNVQTICAKIASFDSLPNTESMYNICTVIVKKIQS